MGLVQRYVLRNHAGPFAAALGALSFALATGELVQLVSRPGAAALKPAVGRLILLSLPGSLAVAIPIAAAAATFLAFGGMGRRGEIVAAGAAGASHWKLIWPVLAGACIVATAATFDTVFLVPEARYAARQLLAAGGREDPTLLFVPGEPIDAFPGRTIIIRGRRGDTLLGVVVFEQGEGASSSLRAAEATVSYDGETRTVVLIMRDCIQLVPDPENPARTAEARLAQLRLALPAPAEDAPLVRRHAKDLALPALLERAREERKALYELHRRLALGLAAPAFVALAAPLALRLRASSRGAGVGAAALLFVGYYAGAMATEAAFERGGAPAWIPWLPDAGLAAAGVIACLLEPRR